jgi:alkylation response protein AidB-like acyl-CoA dehydrogenase
LVERSVPGLEVEETWDSLSLRASGTHDVVLMDACVARSALVERYVPPQGSRRLGDGGGPLLHIPALYLGIALAAWGDALDFAWSHRPRSLPGPIAQLPSVEEQVGRMGMHLQAAHAALYEAAARWDAASPEERIRQRPSLGAVKVFALEAALEVVDLAMRLVGGLSLSRGLPFERYYRDVRAGLHNPPMADVALRALGRKALEEAKPPAPEEGAAAP